jgi:hypothetical protein
LMVSLTHRERAETAANMSAFAVAPLGVPRKEAVAFEQRVASRLGAPRAASRWRPLRPPQRSGLVFPNGGGGVVGDHCHAAEKSASCGHARRCCRP